MQWGLTFLTPIDDNHKQGDNKMNELEKQFKNIATKHTNDGYKISTGKTLLEVYTQLKEAVPADAEPKDITTFWSINVNRLYKMPITKDGKTKMAKI